MGGWRMLAAVGSVTAVVASGCGGDSSSEQRLTKAGYQDEIQTILQDAAEPTGLYTDLVVERRPPHQCAEGVASLEDQVDELIDRVDALRPPADAEPAHDDFIAAARISVDRIRAVRENVAEGKVSCGEDLNQRLYGMPSTKAAEHAIAGLERRGYVILGE